MLKSLQKLVHPWSTQADRTTRNCPEGSKVAGQEDVDVPRLPRRGDVLPSQREGRDLGGMPPPRWVGRAPFKLFFSREYIR